MPARYWTGRISNDFGAAANWDAAPGGPAASSPPGPAETGLFLSGGVDCVLSGDVTIGGLVTGPGYWGKIDLAGHNLAGSPAADFLLAHSGDFALGSGELRLNGGTLGWAGLGGALDRGTSTVHLSGGSAIFARSGDRLNDLLITAEGDGATVLTIGPGTLGLANLRVSSSGSSSVILNTAEHAPRLVVEGDLALVLADSGTITVDQSGGAPDWEIGGDVTVEGGLAGRVAWKCGSGRLAATGNQTQRWDWSLVSGPLEQIVIDKRWGALVLTGSLACRGWTHRLGVFDPGGQEIACHGDFTIEPGGRLAADPGTMDGCSIAVGGRLSISRASRRSAPPAGHVRLAIDGDRRGRREVCRRRPLRRHGGNDHRRVGRHVDQWRREPQRAVRPLAGRGRREGGRGGRRFRRIDGRGGAFRRWTGTGLYSGFPTRSDPWLTPQTSEERSSAKVRRCS